MHFDLFKLMFDAMTQKDELLGQNYKLKNPYLKMSWW